MPLTTNAAQFIKKLKARSSSTEAKKSLRYFKSGKGEYGEGDKFIGVRMGDVFNLAKESLEMPLDEIEKLLESPIHEARAGALSIMSQIARRKKTPEARRKELFDLYLRRHDRVNNWDLVDLGALYVVGIHLLDKPRAIRIPVSTAGTQVLVDLLWTNDSRAREHGHHEIELEPYGYRWFRARGLDRNVALQHLFQLGRIFEPEAILDALLLVAITTSGQDSKQQNQRDVHLFHDAKLLEGTG